MRRIQKLALVGGGKLSGIVAKAYADGLLEGYELVGVLSRTYASAERTAAIAGCRACRTLEELLALEPDYVAEAAGVEAVRDIAMAVLSSGAHLIALSCGAFADGDFLSRVKACALEHGAKVHIPSGAIGGFDVLQTITLMAHAGALEERVKFFAHKRPAAVRGSALDSEDLAITEREVFSGSAREAIALLPHQVNVAVAASLATMGPENTGVRILVTPDYVGDDHRISVGMDGFRAELDIYSADSSIAGWSVVTLLRNLTSPISFH